MKIYSIILLNLDSFPHQGIAVVDRDFSHASANVTEGGVGSTYATVRMKSQRSHPLNYEVEFYVWKTFFQRVFGEVL